MSSYYAVLGLDSKCSEADIKKAYRKKARDSHPDKNPNDPNAAKKFMKIKEAYDFLSNNAKRVEYDNKQAQQKRDAQRWAAYQAHYNQWSAPKSGADARKDEDEWEALNRGEAYYTKWMKDKIAKKQKAAWEAKKEKLSERQRLLREWESDQRGRYERTLI